MAVLVTHHTNRISKLLCCSSSTSISPMATLQSLALSFSVSRCSLQRRFPSGLISLPSLVCQNAHSSFYGKSLQQYFPRWASLIRNFQTPRLITMMVKPTIQFIQGTDEQTIPDVRLTKSRDGTNGKAIFSFEQPSVFDSSKELGDITGFYMIDEEGVLQSVDVSAKFVKGKPARIEAKYVMRSPQEWDRFMRFMERYSNENDLQFIKK